MQQIKSAQLAFSAHYNNSHTYLLSLFTAVDKIFYIDTDTMSRNTIFTSS